MSLRAPTGMVLRDLKPSYEAALKISQEFSRHKRKIGQVVEHALPSNPAKPALQFLNQVKGVLPSISGIVQVALPTVLTSRSQVRVPVFSV
ncbi:hypothetical protein VNO77_34101 [Canavalia gladiata]|uniref:Uncharacterized protein n=1 Tax=Canavalia gladiata TaxID=3824 RepID=A0AAN9KGZ8_CANGL